MTRPVRLLLVTSLLFASIACDSSSGSMDAGADSAVDASTSDGARDAASDAAHDAASDAAHDAASDAAHDGAADAAIDGSSDAAADAADPPDATVDAAGPCSNAFGCKSSATPVCENGACVAGPNACTGDDSAEPDDGPSAARLVAYPSSATPTVVSGAVCGAPPTEADWVRVVAASSGWLRVTLDWSAVGVSLHVRAFDATGGFMDEGAATATGEALRIYAESGSTYYFEIASPSPATTVATRYTLTLSIPECGTSFACPSARPYCDLGLCVAGPTTCVGDDASEPDDGPAQAVLQTTAVGVATVATRSVCGVTGESDWFRVDVAAGEGLVLSASWSTSDSLQVVVYDALGDWMGESRWTSPETVTLTYLPAGSYYAEVVKNGDPSTSSTPYALTTTRTPAQSCKTSTDCAASYGTQRYRSVCAADGSCGFLATNGETDGMPCDTDANCASGVCSYVLFESDAAKSVCTRTCKSTAECASFGPDFRCTSGTARDQCVPSCTTALECGVDLYSPTVDFGAWDYFTCDVATGTCTSP